MKAKIYTRTGDTGQTSIVGGQRLPKDAARIEAYGTVDELNSHLGILAADQSTAEPERKIILGVQNTLFNVGAYLAGVPECGVSQKNITILEQSIDEMDRILPPLTAFILPGGCSLAARAHIARTVCRRAERRIVSCLTTMSIDPMVLTFVNRLSDWLFTFARKANLNAQTPEITWQK